MTATNDTKDNDISKQHTVSTRDPANFYRTTEYRTIYANVCQVTVSAWDVQILFCRGGRLLGETKIEEVATVYLAHSQAKALLGVLAGQIAKHEQQHGVMEGPDGVTLEHIPEPSEAAQNKGTKHVIARKRK